MTCYEKLIDPKKITNRDEVSIDKYFHEISKEDLLTPEEEVKTDEENQEK